jgi:hypothetical protein
MKDAAVTQIKLHESNEGMEIKNHDLRYKLHMPLIIT